MTPEEYLAQQNASQQDATVKQASFLSSQPLPKSPDDTAKAFTLARGLGLPPQVVDVNYKSFAQKVLEKRNETVLGGAPKLAGFLLKDENYRIASDTIEEMSWWEVLPKQFKEAGKAIPGGVVTPVGTALEGVGQLMTPDDGGETIDLRTRIAQAQSKTPEEIAAMRQEIFKQGGMNPAFAQSILSDVLDGSLKPEDAIQALGPLAGLKEASVALQQSGKAVQDYAAGMLPAEKGMEDSFGRSVGSGLGSLLSIIGVGLATGPVGATAFGAAGGAGEATSRARKAGQDEDTQTLAAVWGIIPGMSDAIPVERILANPVLKAGMAHFFRSIGKQALVEGGQEAVQEMLQNQIARSLYAPDKSLFADVASSFATGGFVGALVDAGRIAVNAALPGRMRRGQTAASQAPATGETLENISQNAQASVLRERSPETFEGYVKVATGDQPVENIYVPADKFVEYFQGVGVDPFELMDDIGLSKDDLDAALESGDLKIPTSTFAGRIAGSEHDQFFKDNGRFDPDGMSMTEAQEFELTKNDLMDEAWEEAENARVEAEMLRPVDERIYDEMVHRLRLGGQSTDVATALASLPQSFYRTQAAREGISPEEYLARYPLPQFRGAVPEGMQPKNVDALSRTLAEARGRKEVAPKLAPSLLEFISDYGGIANDRGELRARDAEVIKRGKGKKTLRLRRSSLKDGMKSMFGGDSGKRFGVDDVAQAAIESGFLMDHPIAQEYRAAMEEGRQVPDITQALWDEIDNELRDGPRPASAGDAETAKADYLNEIEDYLDSLGVSLTDDDATIRAAIEADQEGEGRKYGQGLLLFQDGSKPRPEKLVWADDGKSAYLDLTKTEIKYFDSIKNNKGEWQELTERVPSFEYDGKRISIAQDDMSAFSDFILDERIGYGAMGIPPRIRQYFQDASNGPRGSIAFPTAGIGKGDTVIRVFETGNLSTVLHEFGHYFMTAIQADAARGVQHSVEDMDAAKAWWRENAGSVAKDAMRIMPDVAVTAEDVIAALDNGTTGDLLKDGAIDIGMQEQFARGFEVYLFEGKSPSVEMRGVFAKFSAWLVSVYRKIAGLNVNINDDIRGVFDRMLATDEEITAAKRDLSMEHPLFASAEEMGLSPP